MNTNEARLLNQKIHHKISALKTMLEEVTREIQVEIQRLDHQTSYDGLTGLLRREAFEREFSMIKESGYFAVLDIDHFKQINDKKGHVYGDEVLKQVGSILSKQSAKTLVGRWGGEEFVLWSSEKNGLDLVEKIRQDIEESGLCTISIGVSHRSNQEDLSKLFKNSDLALYRAKKSGRNRVVASLSLAA